MLRWSFFGRVATVAALAAFATACNPTPTVTGVSPSSGPESGGVNVTVTGTNFKQGAVVTLDGRSLGNTQFVSATELSVAVPAGAVGSVQIGVLNPNEHPSAESVAFSYTDATPPELVSVMPSGELAHDAIPADVRADYSESIASATVTVQDQAAAVVEGTVSFEGTTVVFTPTAPFAPGNQYTVTITQVMDGAANAAMDQTAAFSITAAPAARRRR